MALPAPRADKKRRVDWSFACVRNYVIRVAYDGSSFHGLALQNETPEKRVPTVERVVEAVLQKTQLIATDLSEANCSRCGRTDRGVHARANYLSVKLRLTKDGDPYDYKRILNDMLPPSVRVSWVKPVSVCFDARFHCLYRMYKYLFSVYTHGWAPGYRYVRTLDLDRMAQAAHSFVGEHDFRNFCKIDPSANKTTRRRIFQCSVSTIPNNPHVACLSVTGPAFLWHQVRCIVGCLLEVGAGRLDASVILDWLNIDLTPNKPPYPMASPEGLILWECCFEGITDQWRPLPTPSSLTRGCGEQVKHEAGTRKGTEITSSERKRPSTVDQGQGSTLERAPTHQRGSTHQQGFTQTQGSTSEQGPALNIINDLGQRRCVTERARKQQIRQPSPVVDLGSQACVRPYAEDLARLWVRQAVLEALFSAHDDTLQFNDFST